MKTLFAIIITCLTAFAATAQTTSNLSYRVTVETVTAGVTNTASQSTVRLDWGNAKDNFLISGIIYAYAQYQASGGTNDLNPWLKNDIKDRLVEYGRAKASVTSSDTAAKITLLLTQQPDLLSAGDLSSLATIAAKAP